MTGALILLGLIVLAVMLTPPSRRRDIRNFPNRRH